METRSWKLNTKNKKLKTNNKKQKNSVDSFGKLTFETFYTFETFEMLCYDADVIADAVSVWVCRCVGVGAAFFFWWGRGGGNFEF